MTSNIKVLIGWTFAMLLTFYRALKNCAAISIFQVYALVSSTNASIPDADSTTCILDFFGLNTGTINYDLVNIIMPLSAM